MKSRYVSNDLWKQIQDLEGQMLLTPARRKTFRITGTKPDSIILSFSQSQLEVCRNSFEQTLKYLIVHGHQGQEKQIAIDAHTDPEKAGPLCRAARTRPDGSHGSRVVTYTLPTLAHLGLVRFGMIGRRSSVWLCEAEQGWSQEGHTEL